MSRYTQCKEIDIHADVAMSEDTEDEDEKDEGHADKEGTPIEFQGRVHLPCGSGGSCLGIFGRTKPRGKQNLRTSMYLKTAGLRVYGTDHPVTKTKLNTFDKNSIQMTKPQYKCNRSLVVQSNRRQQVPQIGKSSDLSRHLGVVPRTRRYTHLA